MELKVSRLTLEIHLDPTDLRDEAFIEEVLGLWKDGDWVKCRRVDTSNRVFLEICKEIKAIK